MLLQDVGSCRGVTWVGFSPAGAAKATIIKQEGSFGRDKTDFYAKATIMQRDTLEERQQGQRSCRETVRRSTAAGTRR